MGFKSVFVNNDYVYLNSGGWSLRFDDKYINPEGSYKRNWQYMPIYTEMSDLDNEIIAVLNSISNDMNVFLHYAMYVMQKKIFLTWKKFFQMIRYLYLFLMSIMLKLL